MTTESIREPAPRWEVLLLLLVGLLTSLGVAWGVFTGLGRPIDGDEVLRERFGATTWPLDLVVENAHKMGQGDRMVRLRRSADSTLGDGVPDVVIVHVYDDTRGPKLMFPPEPRERSDKALESWREDAQQTFKEEITRGKVSFGPFESLYIRERLYRDTGRWVDSMRVNLSTPELPIVLYAEFPPEVDGSAEGLEALLEGLAPYPPTE